ncbi:MAG: DUF362 domain-containing protein [Bacteroidota bacterium]|jgi:hypothetical protein|nr:DUF362 domain-containing protein [Bacteroidota bacterium]
MRSHDAGRRRFLTSLAAGAAATTMLPAFSRAGRPAGDDIPATNIADALKFPRTATSMPGRYPGRVVDVFDAGSVVDGAPVAARAEAMLARAMRELTGEADVRDAWRQFVSPDDMVGLKVNPVAGALLSTSVAVTAAAVAQLEAAGIPRANIMIWDRREFELHEAGFTAERFPGIRIRGTECKDASGAFRDASGALYGEARIDRAWSYWADCEESYDAETLPYMINEGKHSYFSRIVTEEVTKIVNIPILKNAGPTVTLCLKNLAYGAISNTGRLHKQLWGETCAQVPCFPPLRDKTVLNIVDGLIGCYQGGPGANPQFIVPYHRILAGSDPVAVDRVGYEIVLAKRMETGVQKAPSARGTAFMDLAAGYGLGIADLSRISHVTVDLS